MLKFNKSGCLVVFLRTAQPHGLFRSGCNIRNFHFPPRPFKTSKLIKRFWIFWVSINSPTLGFHKTNFVKKLRKLWKNKTNLIFSPDFSSPNSRSTWIHCQITRQSPFGQKFNLELQIWKNDMFLARAARHTKNRHLTKNDKLKIYSILIIF